MHIIMFSMTPLFAEKSMGGAQKQLKKVALFLAEAGHQVTILCTQRSDAMQAFHWHKNLQVVPTYRFKQPFPEPYATATFNIADAIQQTGEHLAQADVFYSHDGGLIFPYVYQHIPTVVSLRSILFSETLQSGYLFQGDALIVPSQHTADAWIYTAGRFFPEFKNRIHVIHNGLDFDVYRPTDAKEILDLIPVHPDEQQFILYPHRPEEAKGIRQMIAVLDLLVHQHDLPDVRVLLPQWIDSAHSASVREFYDDLQRDIQARGLSEHFVFHEWVSDALMPQYLSLGDVSFAPGNYVETFGNVPYESLACGTPVIAARVGPYREMLPDELLVDYGDVAAAAEKAATILKERRKPSAEVLRWLHDNFQQDDMVEAYAERILNANKLQPIPYHFQPINATTRFKLAPWCYLSHKGVYNDFLGDYQLDAALMQLVDENPQGFTFAASQQSQIMAWYRDGYLVPLQRQES